MRVVVAVLALMAEQMDLAVLVAVEPQQDRALQELPTQAVVAVLGSIYLAEPPAAQAVQVS